MNFKIISLLTIFFLFLGCSSKSNQYATPSDILQEQALTLTQKAVLKEGTEIKAYVVVTYISKIDHKFVDKDEKAEKFVVSIRIPNENEKDLYNKLDFSVNGKKDYTVRSLDNNADILQILPAVSSWNRYFLVKAPKNDSKRGVSLVVSIANYDAITMNFLDSYGNLPYSRKQETTF